MFRKSEYKDLSSNLQQISTLNQGMFNCDYSITCNTNRSLFFSQNKGMSQIRGTKRYQNNHNTLLRYKRQTPSHNEVPKVHANKIEWKINKSTSGNEVRERERERERERVCVCVSERERERDRPTDRQREFTPPRFAIDTHTNTNSRAAMRLKRRALHTASCTPQYPLTLSRQTASFSTKNALGRKTPIITRQSPSAQPTCTPTWTAHVRLLGFKQACICSSSPDEAGQNDCSHATSPVFHVSETISA